jgi:hypothetical protein
MVMVWSCDRNRVVAVGRRDLEGLGGELATGTGLVLDDHRHAEFVLELLASMRAIASVPPPAGSPPSA